MNDVNLVGNFKNCFLNLRWLQWYGCPSNLMATSFRPEKLVILKLSWSNITEQWGGWSQLKCAEKLKILELWGCDHLRATPDLSTFRELEILDLSYCKRLRKIHPLTKKLKSLHVEGCEELEKLPIEVGTMKELRELTLGRSSITEIPMVEGFMTKLKSLKPRYCHKLTRLPDSIGSLTELITLDLYGCVSLTTIPESIGKLKLLSRLNIGRTNIKQLPESIGNLHNLETLLISETPIERLPATIGMLKKLRFIQARELHGLTEVPMEIGELTHSEHLYLDGAPISRLPNLPGSLRHLSFSGCSMESVPNLSYLSKLDSLSLRDMNVIPELPSSLSIISFHGCQTLSTLPSFSKIERLCSLFIVDCTGLMEIGALEELNCLEGLEIINCSKISKLSGLHHWLRRLSLKSCDALESLLDLSTLIFLEELRVVECKNIVEIQGLDTMNRLNRLYIHDCFSLGRIGDISNLTLTDLGFSNCPKLRDMDCPCIDKFTSLLSLCLDGRSPSLKLPDLSKFKKLMWLVVKHFEELRNVPKLQELKSLTRLYISGCKSLEDLPDFSEFTNLECLDIYDCEKLTGLRGLEDLRKFCRLGIFGCPSLKQLPKLPNIIDEQKSEPWWCE